MAQDSESRFPWAVIASHTGTLLGRVAAVNEVLSTSAELGFRTGKKQRHVSDVFRLAETSNWVQGSELLGVE